MTIPPHPLPNGASAPSLPPAVPPAPETSPAAAHKGVGGTRRVPGAAVPPPPVAPGSPGAATALPARSAVSAQAAAAPAPPVSGPAPGRQPAPKRASLRPKSAESAAPSPEDLDRAENLLGRVTKTFAERVVGQEQLRVALVSTLIAGGHILLESVPGLAKTTASQTLADAVSGSFHRIQCTPDLMPNDIIGTQILNYASGEMSTQLGPVHANIVLLDEINRSSAKTQSAMLEAMQERQTSIGGVVYALPRPFMVLATQNPIEEEGTYVLPEAQMDRFLMKEVLTYPKPSEEADVLDRISKGAFSHPISTEPITTQDVLWLQATAEKVWVDPVIKQYIVALVNTSRGGGPRPVPGIDQHVRVGASPRGGIALMKVAQAIALQAGRTYVTPDDVGLLRHSVLRHRLVRTYDALADDIAPESIIDAIFAAVPTP